MQILQVLIVLSLLVVVTFIQVRKLIGNDERRSAIVYIALMTVVAAMYSFIFLSGKLVLDPINILTYPLENIGKELLKQ